MTSGSHPSSEALRRLGLRSTPQRRAILDAFEGSPPEHLSADEVHARAAANVPELGRGTVYAALAELTELGLLAAVGAPEPVRYETNTAAHDHFRCRLCLRLFDLAGAPRGLPGDAPPGFIVERAETRLEGVCADCTRYENGLVTGVRRIRLEQLTPDRRGAAYAVTEGALGPIALAATSAGMFRIAFPEHADFESLASRAGGRRGAAAARAHVDHAAHEITEYLTGARTAFETPIDWDVMAPDLAEALRATRRVPFGRRLSYTELATSQAPRDLGVAFGANPIPLLAPCHRITRGNEIPDRFVAGPERREWLLDLERRGPVA